MVAYSFRTVVRNLQLGYPESACSARIEAEGSFQQDHQNRQLTTQSRSIRLGTINIRLHQNLPRVFLTEVSAWCLTAVITLCPS